MPRPPETAYLEQPPDWICEIASPSTFRTDRMLKMPLYAAAGVGHVWLVNPLARLVEVYRLHEDKWLLLGAFDGSEPVRAEPFDAVELDVASWWIPEETDDAEEPDESHDAE